MRPSVPLILLGLTILNGPPLSAIQPSDTTDSFRVQAQLALRGGWDSNPLRLPEAAPNDATAFIGLIPQLEMQTHNTERLEFSLRTGAQLRIPLPDRPRPGTADLSSAHLDLHVGLAPEGPLTVRLREQLWRLSFAEDPALAVATPSVHQRAGLECVLHGDLPIRGRLGYVHNVHTTQEFTPVDRQSHALSGRLEWLFAGQDHLWIGAAWTDHRWDGLHRLTSTQDFQPLRVGLGIDTQLTSTLRAQAYVGYGDSFHSEGPRFQHVTAALDFSISFGRYGALEFGGERDFHASYWAAYFTRHRATLSGQFYVGDLLKFALGGVYDHLEFAAFRPEDSTLTVSHEQRAGESVSAFFEFAVSITTWLQVEARYDFDLLHSAFRQQRIQESNRGYESALELWRYARHQVFGAVVAGF